MKNLLKFSFLIGFLFISANVMANDKDFSISIDNINAKKLSFQMTNAKNVALYVYNDKKGELLAEKIRKHDEVSRTYDLKNFPVGTPAEAQALATPFYQNPKMGIERLAKFVEAAKKDPHVDASQVYVIGYCFGGTQALNLARSGADIKGVVSFHGGLAAGVPATNVKAKILAINGLADPMVPAKERAGFEKEMKSIKANYKVVNYKGATHAFTNPGATEIGKKYNIPIAYNKKADEGSWKDLIKFLKQ
jgi:dienelactone hydrolase